MRKILAVFIVILYSVLTAVSLQAQRLASSLFMPYNWEQASLQAARENKLVLVAVGASDAGLDKILRNQPDLMSWMQRKVVAFRIEPGSAEEQAFLPRLWMNQPPVLAFFMPYSDLLKTVAPEAVEKNPAVLREALEEAQKVADIKRSNSRSVRFADIPLQEALKKAEQENKLVFVNAYSAESQASLLMEKNVFNLDQVADFYNSNFINLHLDFTKLPELAGQYGVQDFPAYLFLNPKGKVVYRNHGYAEAIPMIETGKLALEKAKGIIFTADSLDAAVKRAQQTDKMVFGVFYNSPRLLEEMKRNLLADPDVAGLVNQQFVSFAQESDKPAFVFYNRDGELVHKVLQLSDPENLEAEARLALENKGIAAMKEEYGAGNRQPAFVLEYIDRTSRAGWNEEASKAAAGYLLALPAGCLEKKENWELFNRYVMVIDPELFDYLLLHRNELAGKYGEAEVKKKIAALWVAGAEDFVRDGVFDEAGFKAYTKRLKKEKVEGWRNIVRNARMHAAEKTGDWRTYVELAEEKWNEEQISDAELYSWGLKINAQCHDEAIRYKAARWFAWTASEMERKERETGKVNLSSYKGFFEKLVNDLVGKK